MEQSYEMMMARNLTEMKTALASLQLMQQNIMVGTVEGDIYYQERAGAGVAEGDFDPTKPMPGSTGECDWKGLHTA